MSGPRLLRLLAGLLIRGRHAPYLVAELDETFERDIERGISARHARRRYAVNTVASALSLWRWTMRIRILRPGTSWLDLKLGLRMLLKQPGLTLVAVFALSIGIPASLIPFHLVDSLQVALPFDEGDRIVGLRNRNVAEGRTAIRALHDFFIWRDELTTFEVIGAARTDPYNVISDDGRAAPIRGSEITASAFEILRVRPILGRALVPSDEVVRVLDHGVGAFSQLLAGIILGVVAGRWLMTEIVDDAAERVDGPLMLATFAAFMLMVGMAACLAPTLRGLRIRPVEALKEG